MPANGLNGVCPKRAVVRFAAIGKFRRLLPDCLRPYLLSIMKHTKQKTKKNIARGLGRHISKLVVGPLSRLIKKEATKCLKGARAICEKVREHEDLIETVARQVAKQTKRGE